jgi:hypothetical protein
MLGRVGAEKKSGTFSRLPNGSFIRIADLRPALAPAKVMQVQVTRVAERGPRTPLDRRKKKTDAGSVSAGAALFLLTRGGRAETVLPGPASMDIRAIEHGSPWQAVGEKHNGTFFLDISRGRLAFCDGICHFGA